MSPLMDAGMLDRWRIETWTADAGKVEACTVGVYLCCTPAVHQTDCRDRREREGRRQGKDGGHGRHRLCKIRERRRREQWVTIPRIM